MRSWQRRVRWLGIGVKKTAAHTLAVGQQRGAQFEMALGLIRSQVIHQPGEPPQGLWVLPHVQDKLLAGTAPLNIGVRIVAGPEVPRMIGEARSGRRMSRVNYICRSGWHQSVLPVHSSAWTRCWAASVR